MALKEYAPGTAFTGVIGRTFDVSQPAWPRPLREKEGVPNVLFIVQDDTGFGQLGCYGSPINTPNLDALAANGLLFNSMHTTALCSPSRSCILTGQTTTQTRCRASPRGPPATPAATATSHSRTGCSQKCKGAPGRAHLYVDDNEVGRGDIALTMPLMIGISGGIVCGADSGSPVWDKYEPPFTFTGELDSVTVDLGGEHTRDHEAEMRIAMARQ